MTDHLVAIRIVKSAPDPTPAESDVVKPSQECKGSIDESTAAHRNRIAQAISPPRHGKDRRSTPTSGQDALDTLRSEPDLDLVLSTLRTLGDSDGLTDSLSLATIGPLQSRIINALLEDTLPNFWALLDHHGRELLVKCLRNITGINGVLFKIRRHVDQAQKPGSPSAQLLRELLEVAGMLFEGDSFVSSLWSVLCGGNGKASGREAMTREVINLLGSGKIVSTIAPADHAVRKADATVKASSSWLSDGSQYAAWLGRNIACLVLSEDERDDLRVSPVASKLLIKALSLGYTTSLIGDLLRILLLSSDELSNSSAFTALLDSMTVSGKAAFTENVLRWLSSRSRTSDSPGQDWWFESRTAEAVAAVSALLTMLAQGDATFSQNVMDLLQDPARNSVLSLVVRRACLTNLATHDLDGFLERLVSLFGDSIFINHSPTIQQERLTQTLLLTASYVHRAKPQRLSLATRSAGYMQGISSRLSASNPRARWLGMVVGTAVSRLVDKEGSRMNFDMEELQTEETTAYVGLATQEDEVGTMADARLLLKPKIRIHPASSSSAIPQKKHGTGLINGKPVFGPPRPPRPSQDFDGPRITDVTDDSTEHNELVYEKPDSDPEDSDEDATLVDRQKIRPPVYVRTLMSMLRDDKDAPKFQLGLKHATRLIRRKSNFGREVKDHAEELLRILCNLQDPFDTDDFEELRLQATTATLLSDMDILAPWLSRQVFTADYSIAQRCSILCALGLSGRELAGCNDDLTTDELNPSITDTAFPSKRLPERLHSIYAPKDGALQRLEAVDRGLQSQLLRPMALKAADDSTAELNAVKVRTFSSRMEVERTRRKPKANTLSKVFASRIYFPLATYYEQEVSSYGSGSIFLSTPILLVTLLKTITLLLHASGPSTMDLRQLSSHFTELLLSLRVRALNDITILEAVLFGFLTLLEVDQRLAEEEGRRLAEAHQWVENVFERVEGRHRPSQEEAKISTLAAGVLVKSSTLIKAHQDAMFGR